MSKKRREIPRFKHALIETHCHLDYLEQAPLAQIIEDALAIGIERLITISVDPDNLDTVRRLASENAQVFATQGIHPHEAERFDDTVAARIEEGLTDSKVLAVGEIGLDYYYDHAERHVQREVFTRQLRIAIEQDKPVVIHSREADDDTRAILREHAPQLARKGVIHSFTSGLALAEECLSLDFCLGFNGIVTFNKAENVRDIVRATPLEQILLETDSPFLTPVPYRGKENAPFYLPFVAEKLAQIKAVTIEQLLQQTYRNSMALFFPQLG